MRYRGDGDDAPVTTYATGTAFFLKVDGVDFLVTARHNLTGWDLVSDRPLSSLGVSPTHIGIGFWPTQPPGGYQLAEVMPSRSSARMCDKELPYRANGVRHRGAEMRQSYQASWKWTKSH